MKKNKVSSITFTERVLSVVKAIPKGEVLTYGEVADRAGNNRAGRAVGTIMAKNYREDIPCHRVIRSDGSVGHYNRGGAEAKLSLLKQEGARLP